MKQDDKVLETKIKLAKELKRLMQKKPITKISVTELTDNCNLNRKTFYYHFIDIYDLLEWSLKQDTIDILKNFDLKTDFEQAALFVMNYVEKNKHIIDCAINNIAISQIRNFFNNNFHDLVETYIKTIIKEKNYKISNHFISSVTIGLTSMIVSLIFDWMMNINKLDKYKTVDYLNTVLKNSIDIILKEANDKKL